MILRSLQPINWGPFSQSSTLEVEPDVTVITGANDTRKSSLLRLLDAMYRFPNMTQGGIEEYDLNFDYRDASETTSWEKQTEFGCRATFSCGNDLQKYLGNLLPHHKLEPTDEIAIVFNLAPGSRMSTIYRGSQLIANNGVLTKMPYIIGLPTNHQINEFINLAKPNHVELRLLQIAFGREFDASRLKGYSPPLYNRKITQARARLKEAVSKVLPSSMNLTINLQERGTDQQEIAIQPIDLEYGYSPLGSRGTGVKTLLALLCGLLEANAIDQQLMIYIDEPETSLHADAQHRLRGLLEELGNRSQVQVLYATHSASMINNMRPHNIRLLKRVVTGEQVVTDVVNRPIDSNFAAIRSSLGMSPADSLLYAPVSIIVEGVTDSICLPMLLRSLREFDVPGFTNLDQLFPQCHILDGEGDSYLHQIKLAKSQGSKPIVFLDGDKEVSNQEKNEHSDVTFIRIENRLELEELVPIEIYFEALKSLLAEVSGFNASENITPEVFYKWEAQSDDKAKRQAFTKRVARWLYEDIARSRYEKPRTMKRAVELITDASQIKQPELLQLVTGIQHLLMPKN